MGHIMRDQRAANNLKGISLNSGVPRSALEMMRAPAKVGTRFGASVAFYLYKISIVTRQLEVCCVLKNSNDIALVSS